jgi:hypothetical protein
MNVTQKDQPDRSRPEIDLDAEEPDFDAEVDVEDEELRIAAVNDRTRRRVLIPLFLLLALIAFLSLFGGQDQGDGSTPKNSKQAAPP